MVIVAIVLLAAAALYAWFGRARPDSIVEHQRVIETLRDIADQPHDPPERAAGDDRSSTEHVLLLPESADGQATPPPAPTRRTHPDSPTRRAGDDYSSRPTVAHLPTIGPAFPADRPQAAPGAAPPLDRDADAIDLIGSRFQASSSVRRLLTGPSRRRVIAGVAVAAAIVTSAFAAIDRPATSRASARLRARPVATNSRPKTPRPATSATTSTTSPAVTQPVVTAGGDATVSVAFPATFTLRATSPCWVLASAPSGLTLYAGTLQPGQQQQINATGPFVVRLGNTAGIAISVGDTLVNLTGIAKTANLTIASA